MVEPEGGWDRPNEPRLDHVIRTSRELTDMLTRLKTMEDALAAAGPSQDSNRHVAVQGFKKAMTVLRREIVRLGAELLPPLQ